MDKRFKSMTAVEKAEYLHEKGLRCISSKWFWDDICYDNMIEIENVDRMLLKRNMFRDDAEMTKCKSTFIKMFEEDAVWPLPPIIKEAEQAELKPLCFPLTTKQLQIIHELLLGGREHLFIITGVGGSGKSTYINIIQQIFGNDYVSMTLDEMTEGFRLASAVGKRLICSTEIGYSRVTDTLLKSIISNEPLNINPKYQSPYEGRIRSSFIFACNVPPSINLMDTGLLRRFIYYDMDKKIENPDPSMNHKVWNHDDLVNIVKHAMKTNIDNIYEDFIEETHRNLVKYDTVYMFQDDQYCNYEFNCKTNGYKPYNRKHWECVRQLLTDWKMLCTKSTGQ